MNPSGETSDSKAKGEVVGAAETCWLGKDAEWGGRAGGSDSMEPGTGSLRTSSGGRGPGTCPLRIGDHKITARALMVSIHSSQQASLSPLSALRTKCTLLGARVHLSVKHLH